MLRSIYTSTALGMAILAAIPNLQMPAAHAEETKMPRTISLVGHADVRVAPDLAVVTAGVLNKPRQPPKRLPPIPQQWPP